MARVRRSASSIFSDCRQAKRHLLWQSGWPSRRLLQRSRPDREHVRFFVEIQWQLNGSCHDKKLGIGSAAQ
jgi:hypothetical protein